MNRGIAIVAVWKRALALLLCCMSPLCAADVGLDSGAFRLQHDGLLRFSKATASMRGIGKTTIVYDDFELFVDGQFQMIGSSRLICETGNRRAKRYRAEPVCISIVALGEVSLYFPKTGERLRAGKAVYRISDRLWILDGTPMRHKNQGENGLSSVSCRPIQAVR